MHPAKLRSGFALLVGSTFSSLRVRDHWLLFSGNAAFQFSIWMQQIVFGWLLLELGNSPFWLGLGGFCNGAAMVLASPFSGALVDAWERRRVLLLTQSLAIVVNALAAVLLGLGRLEVWHLLLASTLMGVAFTLNMPARQSLTGEIVGRRLLHNATALHTASLNLSRIGGPAAAGQLLALVGPLPILIGNLAANLWTIRQLLRIRYRPARSPAPFRLRGAELLEGFRYVRRERQIAEILLVVGLANFFGLAFVQLLPSLARDSLLVGPGGLGLLTAAFGGGALLGSLVLARRTSLPDQELLLRGAGVLLGALLVALGLVSSLPQAAVLLLLIGATTSVFTPVSVGAIQNLVPDHLSGRVLSIWLLTLGLMPLGSLPAGVLADRMGTSYAVAVVGLICGLACLVLVLLRTFPRPGRLDPRPVPGMGSGQTESR